MISGGFFPLDKQGAAPRLRAGSLARDHSSYCSPTYYERFREAFVNEINEFVACCLDDTRESCGWDDRAGNRIGLLTRFVVVTPSAVPVSLDDAVQAAKIADALTHSFRKSVPVLFDDQGEAIYA